jgi:TPR repeat protein
MNPGGESLQAVDLEARVVEAERLAAAGDAHGALTALKQAVAQGHHYASALLGAWQVLGNFAETDVPAGIERLETAAAAGESAAAAFLANLFAGGLQVEQDWPTSLDWLIRAAQLGNARAEASPGQAFARSPGPVALEGVDWEAVRNRCEPARWLAIQSGAADGSALHAGRPPAQGEKWLLSKWVRSRPQRASDRG